VSCLQKSEEQLDATSEELTLTKEEVKQTKDAITGSESRFLRDLAYRSPRTTSPFI